MIYTNDLAIRLTRLIKLLLIISTNLPTTHLVNHHCISNKNEQILKGYFCFYMWRIFSGALLVKLLQYYKWTFVKFLYEDNPKPWHECQVLLRPIAHTFASNQIRSDNRKVTSHDLKDNFKSIFVDFISNNASGRKKSFYFRLKYFFFL